MLDGVPLLLAFAGGLVATVNPCGFAMLPAYLSFFVGLDREANPRRSESARRALKVGGTVAAGFVVVFLTAGFLLAAGAQALTTALPWAAIVIGVGVALLGLWLLAGREMPFTLPAPARATAGRGNLAVFGFGVAYGVASLSCTLPVFLAVVVGTLPRTTVAGGVAVFAVYAAGMALPLLAVSVALAFGKDTLVRRARAIGRHSPRVAGGLLLVAGAYVVAFWATSLAGGSVPQFVTAVEGLSSRLTTLIGSRPLPWGIGLAVALTLAALLARRGEGSPTDPPRPPRPRPDTAVPSRHGTRQAGPGARR